jgi:hypothetical protein
MYADDQGYNALEAMAKESILLVLEKVFMKTHLTEKVNINAFPER